MVRAQTPANCVVTDAERERAVDLVRTLSTGGFGTEELDSEAMHELAHLLPDPNFRDIIYWPKFHRLAAAVPEVELTPEKVVELACLYKPFAL